MNIPEEAVEAVKSVLRDEGLDEKGGNPHSWRCEFPDLYPNHCTCVDDLARAALEAAWAVMRPEVTTAEELDALPTDSVIRDARGRVWEIYNSGIGAPEWDLMGVAYDEHIPTSEVMAFPPFTVIYRP